MTTGVFIDGTHQPGSGPPRDLVDPATGQVARKLIEADRLQAGRAVEAAHVAFAQDWRGTVPSERSAVLLKLADLVESHADELVDLEVTETGKPLATMRDGELPFAVDNLRFFAGAARSLDGTGAGELSKGYLSLLTRRPVGVVAAITPWNFPLIMAVWKVGPAIAAGCSVVLKPAPATPGTSLRLAELAAEAGLPPGVFNVVTGGAEIGEALVANPGVDMVTLTGSTETGKRVMATAAPTVKRLHLELGGKAPAIVFPDADVAQLGRAIVMGATYNTGQDCTAATRVYVHRSAEDEVISALAAEMMAIRLGHPRAEETDIGPLIDEAHRTRVHGFVQDARSRGANVVCGGEPREGVGAFYPPTLVVGVDQADPIVQEEVFGPVLVVLPFDSEEEAIAKANDVRYGLASSVWTADLEMALRATELLDYGVVWVNDHLPLASEAPHGGLKHSGFGKDLSAEALADFSVTRHVMMRRSKRADHDGYRPA